MHYKGVCTISQDTVEVNSHTYIWNKCLSNHFHALKYIFQEFLISLITCLFTYKYLHSSSILLVFHPWSESSLHSIPHLSTGPFSLNFCWVLNIEWNIWFQFRYISIIEARKEKVGGKTDPRTLVVESDKNFNDLIIKVWNLKLDY